ncbi:hypothetical protein Q8F55_008998 [Vanrija albida]|uniref:Uncharacterized protein n=1 Tax=Vanrija albida TaxID=181172 RepID=A0ABR3PTA0_9TREE
MLLSSLVAVFAVGCAAALRSDSGGAPDAVADAHNSTLSPPLAHAPRALDTRFTVPNAVIDWYADSNRPYENRAAWFPAARERADLWIFQPSGAQLRNSVMLQANLAASETQLAGRWDLPAGYAFQLVLTAAGDKGRILARSHTFDIRPSASAGRNAGTRRRDSCGICALVGLVVVVGVVQVL